MKLILSDCSLPIQIPEGKEVKWINLSELNVSNCVGCFGCWTKTPGRCVIRDDAAHVYPLIAASDKVLYVSRIKYGGYDTIMKTMLERAIPVQQAFLRIVQGETHHVQRAVTSKQAVIVAYGETSEEEQALFRRLVERNARNMNFASHRVVFCRPDLVGQQVRKELTAWGIG